MLNPEKKKKKYIPGKAALEFEPDRDWSCEEAKKLYDTRNTNREFVRYEDCIDGMTQMSIESVDMILADPSFGIHFSGKGSQYNRDASLVIDHYQEIDDYEKFSNSWIKQAARVLKETGTFWCFSGWNNLEFVLSAIRKNRLKTINHIVWKYQFGVFTTKKFVNNHYHLLYCVKNEKRSFFNKVLHYPEDVWDIKRSYKKGERKNGTKLPEEVVLKCIDFGSKPGDLILDPFLGNGTTLACARGAYRRAAGFEINTEMQEIIEHNVSRIGLGSMYLPYTMRWKETLKERGFDPNKCGSLQQTTIPRCLFRANGTRLFEERENPLKKDESDS